MKHFDLGETFTKAGEIMSKQISDAVTQAAQERLAAAPVVEQSPKLPGI